MIAMLDHLRSFEYVLGSLWGVAGLRPLVALDEEETEDEGEEDAEDEGEREDVPAAATAAASRKDSTAGMTLAIPSLLLTTAKLEEHVVESISA